VSGPSGTKSGRAHNPRKEGGGGGHGQGIVRVIDTRRPLVLPEVKVGDRLIKGIKATAVSTSLQLGRRKGGGKFYQKTKRVSALSCCRGKGGHRLKKTEHTIKKKLRFRGRGGYFVAMCFLAFLNGNGKEGVGDKRPGMARRWTKKSGERRISNRYL